MTLANDALLIKAAIIIVAFLLYEFLRLLAGHIFKKFTSSNSITQEDCEKCSEQKEAVMGELRQDVQEVKQVLFIVAYRVGVDENEIRQLVG